MTFSDNLPWPVGADGETTLNSALQMQTPTFLHPGLTDVLVVRRVLPMNHAGPDCVQ